MKHLLTLLIAAALPLAAADTIEVTPQWLCSQADNRNLQLTMATGEIVEGSCLGANMNEISISVKGISVRAERDTVTRVMLMPRRHFLRSLRDGVYGALQFGVELLLSPPATVLGVVLIPAALAYGVVATPICLVRELVASGGPGQEVRLINQPGIRQSVPTGLEAR